MKITFIQLPHFFGKDKRLATLYPLGIGYLASSLKKNHELIPIDLWIEDATVDMAMRMVSRKVPDVFCISVYSTQYPYYKELVRALKKTYPNIPIIAGGPGVTFSCNIFLKNTKTDYCVLGEGDVTLKELLHNLEDPQEVAGIAYKKAGTIVYTKKREQIKDLDSLPWPDRDFFDIERYILNEKNMRSRSLGLRSSDIIAGRGCPYNCTFCSKTFSGMRLRSIEEIKKELVYLKKNYALDVVGFSDELTIISKKRTLELCSIMKEVALKWRCQCRINVVDEEMLRGMKEAGCTRIGYGVEAYSQKILDRMKKHIKVETIVPIIDMTKRIGIEPIVQYMYGFPGEDESSIENTVEFFNKIDHPYSAFTTTLLPGTELYKEALKAGIIKDEEAYLSKLTGGYNLLEPLINMTDFTDKEFIAKKLNLMKRVNRNYYKRHPIIFLKHTMKELGRLLKMLTSNPTDFFNKIRHKLLQKQGKTSISTRSS